MVLTFYGSMFLRFCGFECQEVIWNDKHWLVFHQTHFPLLLGTHTVFPASLVVRCGHGAEFWSRKVDSDVGPWNLPQNPPCLFFFHLLTEGSAYQGPVSGRSHDMEEAWVPEWACGRLSSQQREQELNFYCIKPLRFQDLSNLAGDKTWIHSGTF